VLSNWAERAAHGAEFAKYLVLLPSCVTYATKTFLPKIGLANPAFTVQHLSRDKGRADEGDLLK
jgi:hypothetical protein